MKPLIDESAKSLVLNIRKEVQDGKDVIDFNKTLGLFALDVVASTVFGFKIDTNKTGHEMVEKIKSFFSTDISLKSLMAVFFPSLLKWFHIYIYDYDTLLYLDSLMKKLIDQRIQSALGNKEDAEKDFLSMLMKSEMETKNGQRVKGQCRT